MRETVPRALVADGPRVFRPRDLEQIWALPHKELTRLAERGICRQVAHGYWLLAPLEAWGDDRWRPTVEALAASMAAADFGRDDVALIKLSAARLLGVMPRARGVADVACPIRRHPTETIVGPVIFTKRRVADLDVQVAQTELGKAWVTTREQTIVDLAAEAEPGDRATDVWAVVRTLAREADWGLVEQLAGAQRRRAPVKRLRAALRRNNALKH